MMQSSKAIESVSECLKTGYCMKYAFADVITRTHMKVKKRAKIRNRYNQAPHLIKDSNEKVTTSQLDITNQSQEASPFPAGDHKESINRRAQKHNKNKTEKMAFHLNVTGVQFFQVTNLNRNLTQFRPSEIHCQPDPTK